MSYPTNKWVDFWRCIIGVDLFPADTQSKTTMIKWSKYQGESVSEEQHIEWEKNGSFDKGIAIIMGKIRRGKYKDKYLACIDFDNKKGIEEFLFHFGKVDTLEKLAEKTIVEQHLDDRFKAHVYFIVEKPLTRKSGISGLRNNPNIPSIEVKSESTHGIMFCTPSIHKNGHPYQIIGTLQPTVLDTEQSIALENSINQIYAKHENIRTRNQDFLPTIEEMDNEDYVVYEGNNRHLNLLRKVDSWYSLSNKQLTFDELFARAIIWNSKHLKPSLKENEIPGLVKQSMNWIDEKSNKIIKSDHNENITKHEKLQYEINNNSESSDDDINKLFALIPDKNFVEFVINTAQKTIKQENSLTRLITYTALSAYTKEPLNLGIIAPTSEGKTYPVNEIINFFPYQDVWLIGSMSPKVIVRDKGILVDENNDPIKEDIKELKKLIGAEKNEVKKEDLRRELNSLYEKSKVLIDLTNKIVVFLEPPHQETWNILKPILSHDNEYIEHPYVYKTETSGQEVKHIVTKGWPACIFCSAKDESNWPTWPEIQSRFFITSPNMIKQKYKESNLLIGQKQGLPSLVQEQLIVSSEQVQLAKNCILLIKKELMKNLKNGVWIPYSNMLSQSLPSEKGTDVRIAIRIFTLLNLITKINVFHRFKLKMGRETMSISSYKDLEEVLKFTQNISGIPSYKLDFFINIFMSLFNQKIDPDTSTKDDITEERVALTTTELSEYFKKIKGKAITADNIKKTYLDELKNNGLIDEIGSKIDRRRKIFFPIIDTSSFTTNNKNYTNISESDNNLQYFRLSNSNNFYKIEDNWLEIEIWSLIKYGIGKTNIFKLLDEENNEICICQFIKKYHKSGSLVRYFQTSENCIYSSEVFGKIIKVHNISH